MAKLRNSFKFILIISILSIFIFTLLLYQQNTVVTSHDSSLVLPSSANKHLQTFSPSLLNYPENILTTSASVPSKGISKTTIPKKTKTSRMYFPKVESRVLLFYTKECGQTAKAVKALLDSLRVAVDAVKFRENKSLPLTLHKDNASVGRYSMLVVADHAIYFNKLPSSVRESFTNYAQHYNVTTVFFSKLDSDVHSEPWPRVYRHLTSLTVERTNIQQVSISTKYKLYYSRSNTTLTHINSTEHWTLFHRNVNNTIPNLPSTTASIETVCTVSHWNHDGSLRQSPCIVVTKDSGPYEIFIGSPVKFWMTKIIFMDILRIFSPVKMLRFGRRRWVMIDIDDIFVAPEGRKMNTDDVRALVETQDLLRKFVPGLTFNLGYCGHYYDFGTPAEIQGSAELVRQAGRFQWFPHVYNHQQPHLTPDDTLKSLMTLNKEFAVNHSLIVDNGYSVSPHHSGIYPVVEPLYLHWRGVWNISVASTEQYPNLYPEHLRRGFIHRGIMVLPRQTCKLYTHTISYSTPGLRDALFNAANGGSVFNTILSNPISIFMTHVTNYATDRLAGDLFQRVFEFVQQHTNLELLTDKPLALGKRYFEMFPEDKTPVWTNPCAKQRHREIYPNNKNCSRLPSLIILGPQKTGTTALYTFLKQHPQVKSNDKSRDRYEEVQFFSNDTLYNYGVEWYMNQFRYPSSDGQILFEKSATYFTHSLSPKRIKALLPHVKLIVILHDPVIRAYSWYQHMIAHKSPTALKYSFSHVIRVNQSNESSDPGLVSLRNRCLHPGQYSDIIPRWLEQFTPEQFLFIDGGQLIDDPASALDSVQTFIKVEPLDYSKSLMLNKAKGFYCMGKHCLGPSKGRKYSGLKPTEISFLESFYKTSNSNLSNMLKRLKMPLPKWLTVQLSTNQ